MQARKMVGVVLLPLMLLGAVVAFVGAGPVFLWERITFTKAERRRFKETKAIKELLSLRESDGE